MDGEVWSILALSAADLLPRGPLRAAAKALIRLYAKNEKQRKANDPAYLLMKKLPGITHSQAKEMVRKSDWK